MITLPILTSIVVWGIQARCFLPPIILPEIHIPPDGENWGILVFATTCTLGYVDRLHDCQPENLTFSTLSCLTLEADCRYREIAQRAAAVREFL